MKSTQIFAVVGRSGSGKTTLIEKLIRYFKNMGLRVSVIKSLRHDFNIDHQGKDSHRYTEAGAFSSGIANREKYAVVSEIINDHNPEDIAGKFFTDSDIIIIEGYREGDTKKIEVIGDLNEPPLFKEGVQNIQIIVSDRDIKTDLPVIKRDDIEAIAKVIREKIFSISFSDRHE